MGNKIDIKNAKCTGLSLDTAVTFAKDAGSTITGFELEGYTGAAVERWWGKLVIDVSGIQAKQQMPIFLGHDHGKIVGHSTLATNDKTFKVKGVFSKSTDAAKEVMALAAEGFPWQASIGVSPKTIMELKEGVAMEVNGQSISGPAEIWTESEVYETSFVPLGADGNTSATVFSNIQEVAQVATKTNKEEKMDLTKLELAKLKEARPDLVAAIVTEATSGAEEGLTAARAEGAEGERARIKAVFSQSFPGFENIVEEAMFDGKSLAGDVAMKINAANLAATKRAGEELSKDAPPVVDEPLNNGLGNESGKNAEEKAKLAWDKDAKLRAEFAGSFETYLAYISENDGVRVKTLHSRGDK